MNEYLSKLLYTRESVLPKYVCDHIIHMFDDNKELHKPGEAGGNINYKYRKVTGFLLPKKNDDWFHMESLLYFIVNRHFDQYLKTVNICHCTGETFILPEFNIMKYEKYYTPSCIKKYVNKININCVHISFFTEPKKPNCESHH